MLKTGLRSQAPMRGEDVLPARWRTKREMERRRVRCAVLIVFAVAVGAGLALSDELPTLEERAAAIDRAAQEPDGDRVIVGHISRKLGLPVEALRRQHAQTGLGWGEILIAHRLGSETGLTFEQVVAEFRGGRTWGDIARDHNADLGRLVSDVQQSQEAVEQRAEDKAPHVGAADKSDQPNRSSGKAGAGAGGARGRR